MLLESVGEIVFDITGMELFKQLKNTMNLNQTSGFTLRTPVPQSNEPFKGLLDFSFYSSDTPTSAISIIEAFKLKKHLGAGPSQKCPALSPR